MAVDSQYLESGRSAWQKIGHGVLMFGNRSFDNLLGLLYEQDDPLRDDQHFVAVLEHLAGHTGLDTALALMRRPASS